MIANFVCRRQYKIERSDLALRASGQLSESRTNSDASVGVLNFAPPSVSKIGTELGLPARILDENPSPNRGGIFSFFLAIIWKEV